MFRVSTIALFVLGVAACSPDNQGNADPNATASTTADASNSLDNLNPEDRKAFAGGGQIGGPIATITIPQSKDEIAWLESGDSDAFVKAAKHAYPEIGSIKFTPSPDMKEDAETLAMYRNSFYAGLYFAKQINTGDGISLFNLMTKCGRLKDPTSGADMGAANGDHKTRWLNLQFFPTFRRMESDEKIDLQILFERSGDKIIARSPLFSSHVVDGPSFMRDHGVRCI